MVKNSKGGKGGKKFARKHVVGNNYNAKLRISEEEDEVYACVVKLLGNGMCHVNCLEPNDSAKLRLCIIRNKFRGRGKRDNQLIVGTYVLVGVRSWESTSSTIEKCDLIEVYNNSEVVRLKDQVNRKWNNIHVAAIHESGNDGDEVDFVFSNDNNDELREEIENELNTEEGNENAFMIHDEIDIDDI